MLLKIPFSPIYFLTNLLWSFLILTTPKLLFSAPAILSSFSSLGQNFYHFPNFESQKTAIQNLCESKINMPPLDGLSPPSTRHSLVTWTHTEAQAHTSSCFRYLWEVSKLHYSPAATIGHWKNFTQQIKKKEKKEKRKLGVVEGRPTPQLTERRKRLSTLMLVILVLWHLFMLFLSTSCKCHGI